MSENTNTQPAGVVVMLSLNLGETLALLAAVSRNGNTQTIIMILYCFIIEEISVKFDKLNCSRKYTCTVM